MKIHLFDKDERQFIDPDYLNNHGPFSAIAIKTNEALQKLGFYESPDNADFVGVCDGLDTTFKYKDKKSFFWGVWEFCNTLPNYLIETLLERSRKSSIFGLSNQITDLYHKYSIPAKTLHFGCDLDFWKPTIPKSNKFRFLSVNSSSVRSGIEYVIVSYLQAFGARKDTELVIKDTNQNPIFIESIHELQRAGVNIIYINERQSFSDIRDLYSSSHVCVNFLRCTSGGLIFLEAPACGCEILTTDVSPHNEIAGPLARYVKNGITQVSIKESIPKLVGMGLHNSYPEFPCPEEPLFYNYDINECSKGMVEAYSQWADRTALLREYVGGWSWEKTAANLVNYLS